MNVNQLCRERRALTGTADRDSPASLRPGRQIHTPSNPPVRHSVSYKFILRQILLCGIQSVRTEASHCAGLPLAASHHRLERCLHGAIEHATSGVVSLVAGSVGRGRLQNQEIPHCQITPLFHSQGAIVISRERQRWGMRKISQRNHGSHRVAFGGGLY
jgi:hypothetical protein